MQRQVFMRLYTHFNKLQKSQRQELHYIILLSVIECVAQFVCGGLLLNFSCLILDCWNARLSYTVCKLYDESRLWKLLGHVPKRQSAIHCLS